MCTTAPAGVGASPALATTQGGGLAAPATTTAAPAAAAATISAALQQLVTAVQALSAVIARMGNGSVAGGGAGAAQVQSSLQTGAQAAPAAADGMSAAQHAMMSLPTVSGSAALTGSAKELLGASTISASDMSNATTTSSGKVVFGRSAPEDRTKAAAVLNRLMQSTAKYQNSASAQAAGYDFNKFPVEAGGLVHAIKGGQNLNLDDPGMLLYRKQGDGSLKLIGAALGSNNSAPDLGMGTWHVHGAGNVNMMKHLWFTPGDLDTAFNEATPPASKV